MADAVLEGKQIREEMMQAKQDKAGEEEELAPPEKSIMEMGETPAVETAEEVSGTEEAPVENEGDATPPDDAGAEADAVNKKEEV
jgi:hypothetical protein